MIKMSTYQLLGLPETLAVALALVFLAIALAPWFGGLQLGPLRVPDLSGRSGRVWRFIAPIAFVISVSGFIPIWESSTIPTFEARIDEPDAGDEVPEVFRVDGWIKRPTTDHKFWLMSVNDTETKFWPQQDLVLDDNGVFHANVRWPITKENVYADSATIAIIALPREGRKLLDAYVELRTNNDEKAEVPSFITDEQLLNEGKAVVVLKQGVIVTKKTNGH
jgi:hypothetical protein